MISIIAVIGKNRELGKDNHLLWHIPGDLKRFRALTTGHPVIMGRKTFESIGHALPGRTNFVISRSMNRSDVTVVSSLDEAFKKAQSAPGGEEQFVIGGSQIYAQAIGRADRLYLTVVDARAPDADVFFPDYSRFTRVISEEPQEENGIRYTHLILEK